MYVLLASIFFPGSAALVIFCMYLASVVLVIGVAAAAKGKHRTSIVAVTIMKGNSEVLGALCLRYFSASLSVNEVMKRHLLCTLCGGHLHFNHMADFKHGLVQETARCPDCGIRVRQRLHKLQ